MDIPPELIACFPPSPDLLLDRARRNVDDAMLRDIAQADYGYMAEEMLVELRPIRDNGILPSPMHWQLVEVLRLIQWSDPENPNRPPFEPGPRGLSGHQTRLFACAVLLRAATQPASGYDGGTHDSTLAQCLISAKALGDRMTEAVGSFLIWELCRQEMPLEPVFSALGLLVVAARVQPHPIAHSVLGSLAALVLVEESNQRKAVGWSSADPPPAAFSVQQGFWQPLADELKHQATALAEGDDRTNLELCSLFLEGAR
jgi:hypothetical protein